MKSSGAIAREVIRELESRAGFDHWWDDIDWDIREEIEDAIADIIEEGTR